jgi:LysR family hydrogen peroxide-inducible transcriptional activator
MEMHQLRYFVAIAETGSVSRAAIRCEIAQPSVSQQLQKLERSLGMQVFDRRGRRMLLTDAGRALLPRAKRILSEALAIKTKLVDDLDAGKGRLAIGAIPTIAPYIVPEAVRRVQKACPDCELIIREDLTQNLVEQLLDSEIDVALLATHPNHAQLESVPFGEEELVAAVPGSWPASRDGMIGLAELRDAPAISLHEMHCLGQQVNVFCEMRRIHPRIACRTTQLSTILELVGLGLGVSLVPAMAAQGQASRNCRFLRIRSQRPARQLLTVTRVDQRSSKPIACLLDAVRHAVDAIASVGTSGKHRRT